MPIWKTTLALMIVAVQLLAFTFPASAQLDKLKNTTPEQRATVQTDLMKLKLGLTPEQTRKVVDINLKYAKRMDPIIKGSAGPFMRMRQMKEINQEKEAELKQVLSPEQFEKFLASKEEMREKLEEKIEEKATKQR
jgi:hypothetical protein